MAREVTINKERGLYVIPASDGGYSCLGFDVAHRRNRLLQEWMSNYRHMSEPGTLEAYREYEATMADAAEYAKRTGQRCPIELTPQLEGLEGRRVQVTDREGTTRRFWVGKSTGWMPVHLEIARKTSTGGTAVYGAPFQRVTVVR